MKNRTRSTFLMAIALLCGLFASSSAQESGPEELPVKLEELSAPDFSGAVEQSGGVCLIPMGIMEKHGPHLPLGTDLFVARDLALRAAGKEYCVVFPAYYAGQIHEARHQPGTIAYSHELIWKMLEETCAELARNGMKKIVLVNGHGGNNSFLTYFCQSQLAARKDYAVVLFSPEEDEDIMKQVRELRVQESDYHAGDLETGMMQNVRPDLVHPGRASEQSGEDLARLESLENGYTAIWWYAKFPNHYAGDGSVPSTEAAGILLEHRVELLAALVRQLKQDDDILELQERFFRESENPLDTEQ